MKEHHIQGFPSIPSSRQICASLNSLLCSISLLSTTQRSKGSYEGLRGFPSIPLTAHEVLRTCLVTHCPPHHSSSLRLWPLPLQVALTQVWLRLWAPVWSFHNLKIPSPSTNFFHVDTIFAARPVPITLLNAAALPLSGRPSPGPVLWSSHAHTI